MENNNLKEKVKLKIAISKLREKENIAMKEKKYSIKKAIIAASFVLLFSGVGIAAPKLVEKIWQEPEKVEKFYSEERPKSEIVEEVKIKAITEDEAKEIALNILKEYGYENEVIESIELIENPVNYDLDYLIKTESKCTVQIDAINSKNYSFESNVLYKDIDHYRGNREDLEKIVRDICKNHNIDLTEYDVLNVSKNGFTEEDAYIWYFNFYKKYGDIVNTYENISVAIIPEINELFWIIVDEKTFENNEIVITEEEAKQIALENEKKVPTGLKIKDLQVALDITEMNGYAYTRTNDYEQYIKQTSTPNYPNENRIYHRVENKIRKAWMVNVQYEYDEEKQLSPSNYSFTYFVDATTGEIIGGTKGRMLSWYKLKNNL